MTKIDKFKTLKSDLEYLKGCILDCTGKNKNGTVNSNNDKHRFQFVLDNYSDNTKAKLRLEAGFGYYGSSSYYTHEFNMELVAKAINCLIPEIHKKMIALKEQEVKDALNDAQGEALAIIQELEKTK